MNCPTISWLSTEKSDRTKSLLVSLNPESPGQGGWKTRGPTSYGRGSGGLDQLERDDLNPTIAVQDTTSALSKIHSVSNRTGCLKIEYKANGGNFYKLFMKIFLVQKWGRKGGVLDLFLAVNLLEMT